jgi:uncharacterized protein YjbJ (UPF0337 family)
LSDGLIGFPKRGRQDFPTAEAAFTIGQTPDRESDKQRFAFRTEADTEGWRAGLSYVEHEKTCACRAKSKGRNAMKSSTKDRAEGTFHELKGKAKEIAGKVTDNPKLEGEGTGEKIAGKVQEKIGQVKKVLGK